MGYARDVGRLRVALCQLDVVVGDLDGNVAKVLTTLAEAEGAGADLAVFPELVITGYPPEDLLVNPAFVEGNLEAVQTIAAKSARCAAVVGFVDDDGDLYNAAAVCAGGSCTEAEDRPHGNHVGLSARQRRAGH